MSEAASLNIEPSIRRIGEMMSGRDSFLITCHENPEGDSVGSSLALYHSLVEDGKRVTLYNHEGMPGNLKFLPGIEKFRRTLPEGEIFDILFILDCGEKERIGPDFKSVLARGKRVVNIDHHSTNKMFGDINLVLPESSSTGEMIYRILEVNGRAIDETIGLCIYVSLMTDTGFFRFANTSPETFRISAEILRKGVSHSSVVNHLAERITTGRVKLLASLLSSLEYRLEGRWASVSTSEGELRENGESPYGLEWFISFIRSIDCVEVAVVFLVLDNGHVKVSMRSKGGVNLTEVATRFGGGGHKRAAGCLVKGLLEDVREALFSEVAGRLGVESEGRMQKENEG